MIEKNELIQQSNKLMLFVATRTSNAEYVQELIDAGAKIDVQDKDGNTPLHIAAYRHGNTPYNDEKGCKDSLDVIEVLIKKNKSIINTKNKRGKTALYQAIFPLLDKEEERIESVIKVVIEKGAAINTDIDTQNYDHMAPLRRAYVSNVSKAVIMFLKNGADPNIQSRLGTALHYAVLATQENVVRILANQGVDCSIRSETHGMTPLYYTAIESRAHGMEEQHHGAMVKVLLENGADPNIKLKDGSHEIMSINSNALPITICMIACYASNLDEGLKQQIEVNENLRDDFKKCERIRNYIDRILLDVQSEIERGGLKIGLNFGYSCNLRKFIEKSIEYRRLEKLLEDEEIRPCYYALGVYIREYIEEHVLIDGKRYTKKHVFLHNNAIILDILSEVYGRKLKGMPCYELEEFVCEFDKKFKDICNVTIVNTLFDFDVSRLRVIVPTLHQLAYVEVLRLLENGKREELRYRFGILMKAQKAVLEEQIEKQIEVELSDNVLPSDEEDIEQPQEPIVEEDILPKRDNSDKQPQKKVQFAEKPSINYYQLPPDPEKPKSNNSNYYISGGATAGLVIGLVAAAAYLVEAATLTPVLAVIVLIAAAVGGALLGAGMGYVSRCLDNVETVGQSAVPLPQSF